MRPTIATPPRSPPTRPGNLQGRVSPPPRWTLRTRAGVGGWRDMSDVLPLDDWGGTGPVLHLAHAHGFPPGTYRPPIHVLRTRFHVVSLRTRQLVPGQDPRALRSWDDLVDDLAHSLRAHGLEGVLGVGHSVGGTCSLLASAGHPGLFRAVVALDPVLF